MHAHAWYWLLVMWVCRTISVCVCVLGKGLRGHVSQAIPGEWALLPGLGAPWTKMKMTPPVAHGQYLVLLLGRGLATPSLQLHMQFLLLLLLLPLPAPTHHPHVVECHGGGLTS